MRAVVALEFIGQDQWAYRQARRRGQVPWPVEHYERAFLRPGPIHWARPWVARVVGLDAHNGVVREFLDGQIDYSRANSVGSRGVWLYFTLTPGFYEVNAHESWSRRRRYYIQATEDGTYAEVPGEEVEAWLLSLRSVASV